MIFVIFSTVLLFVAAVLLALSFSRQEGEQKAYHLIAMVLSFFAGVSFLISLLMEVSK